MQGCDKKKKAAVPRKTQAPNDSCDIAHRNSVERGTEESPAPVVATPPPAQPAKAKAKPKSQPEIHEYREKDAPRRIHLLRPPARPRRRLLKPPGNPADASSVIAAAVPNAQLVQQKEETSRMVDATENALKGLTRSLSDEEKSMKSQIQSYLTAIAQSDRRRRFRARLQPRQESPVAGRRLDQEVVFRRASSHFFLAAPAALIFANISFAGPWYGPSIAAAFCRVATASARWFCLA